MSLIYLKVRTLSHVFILSHQKGVTIKGKGPKKRKVKFNTFAIRARNCPFGRGQKSAPNHWGKLLHMTPDFKKGFPFIVQSILHNVLHIVVHFTIQNMVNSIS